MRNFKDKPSFLFTEISPKRYFIYWLWSIFFFIVFGTVGYLFNIYIFIVLTFIDVLFGIVFFIGAVASFLSDFFSHKIYLRKIHIDKWYLLAILAIIVFACLFYFKITKDSEIKLKKETPTVMDCLKLGSNDARISCIKYYHPKQ